MDALCFTHKSYKARVMTHRNKITVDIEKDGKCVHNEWITPEQFITLLMRDASIYG